MKPAVELTDVSKMYRKYAYRRQFATLKSAFLKGSLASDLSPEETFLAVNHVSLRVTAGSAFGIVGRNGSGKSTMLKLIAGITKPTSGTVRTEGRISALIELGAGFHPEISGRENVFINGVMLGLSRRQIMRRFDEIVEFAELEDVRGQACPPTDDKCGLAPFQLRSFDERLAAHVYEDAANDVNIQFLG